VRHDERGLALPLALFVLIVLGALVAGSFSLARLEQQSGRNTLFIAQAREAAEGGLNQAVASLDPVALQAMSAGGAAVGLPELGLDGAIVVSDVRRLTASVFLVRAQARRQTANAIVLATRSLGALIRLVPAEAGAVEPQMIERGWFSLY
jgi:Tfp pilus assembly protein PilX